VHDGNPITTWMMSNVLMLTSKFSGLKHPTKEKPEQKIDGPVALLLAAGRALMFAPEADINEFLDNPIHS
jgi:phage terminase large subunit-like protein